MGERVSGRGPEEQREGERVAAGGQSKTRQ